MAHNVTNTSNVLMREDCCHHTNFWGQFHNSRILCSSSPTNDKWVILYNSQWLDWNNFYNIINTILGLG